MISKSLSTSVAFAKLFDVCPDLAEFAQSLYPLLVAHADDFGREQGDIETIKYRIHPRSPRSAEDFSRAMEALTVVGLIHWYGVKGRHCYQIVKFDDHQTGLHKRTRSQFPGFPGNSGKFPEPPGTHGTGGESSRPTKEKRTELKRREEDQDQNQDQDPRSARRSVVEIRRPLRAALHAYLDAHPGHPVDLGELTEQAKQYAARTFGAAWTATREIAAVVDGVVAEREKRRVG